MLTSATASAAFTASHYAIYSASTGGTQRTDWQTITAADFTTAAPKALAIGDQLQWAVGACRVTMD